MVWWDLSTFHVSVPAGRGEAAGCVAGTWLVLLHRIQEHTIPWGEGVGAIFALDEVLRCLSSPAGVCLNGDKCLAPALTLLESLWLQSSPFPWFPHCPPAPSCSSGVPHAVLSVPADCRYTCHQECRSLIQLDCHRPGQWQSQLSPESTLLPPCSQVRRGGGSGGHSPAVTGGFASRERISCSQRVFQGAGLVRAQAVSVAEVSPAGRERPAPPGWVRSGGMEVGSVGIPLPPCKPVCVELWRV